MKLSDNAQKMAIVERLVKEGAIDFTEAIELLKEADVAAINWPLPYSPGPGIAPAPWEKSPFVGTNIMYLSNGTSTSVRRFEPQPATIVDVDGGWGSPYVAFGGN